MGAGRGEAPDGVVELLASGRMGRDLTVEVGNHSADHPASSYERGVDRDPACGRLGLEARQQRVRNRVADEKDARRLPRTVSSLGGGRLVPGNGRGRPERQLLTCPDL